MTNLLKAIQTAIEGMKGPYDYKKTAAVLEERHNATQAELKKLRNKNKSL